MRVSVLIPEYDFKETHPEYVRSGFRDSERAGIPYVENPLGLMYLSSALKENGHEVELIDGYFHNREDIIDRLKQFEPDLVGIQATAPFWFRVKDISKQIKYILDVPIVVGGSHIRYAGGEIIGQSEHIDYGIVGDGEPAIVQLCEVLKGQKKPEDVDGLFWKEEDNVQHAKNKTSEADLHELPFPDREEFDLYRYRPSLHRELPVTSLITARGCKMGCLFCHAAADRYRTRKISDIISEMKEIEEQGIREVLFYDQTMGADRERLIKLCEEIIEQDFDFWLQGNLRIDEVDTEVIRKMKEAGFWKVCIGIESGVQKSLNKLNKNIDVDKIKKAVEIVDSFDIQISGTFILGIPGETKEEARKTIEFAKELPIDFVKFFPFTPFPGSPIYENPENGKIKDDPLLLCQNRINFVPETMTEEELRQLIKNGTKEFYSRPGYILRRIKKIRTFEDIKQNILGALAYIF